MKFLVIGCGSIGERHINNLNNLYNNDILVHDINKKRLSIIKDKYKNIKTFNNLDDALNEKPDGALVCTPPSSHILISEKIIDHNIHVFIEKPISHNLRGVDKFLDKAKKKNLIVLVGYNWRFHPLIKMIKKTIDDDIIGKILSVRAEFGKYLPNWRPYQDYRKNYSAINKLGGGIILDSSHEIDYICWILGEVKEVFCFADKLSNLEVDVEDTAEILLKFKNKAICEIHLDFIQKNYSRNCKFIGEKGDIVWNFSDGNIKIYKENKLTTICININSNEMYIEEIKHFLDCINGKLQPIIGGDSARNVLMTALAAKESVMKRKSITLQKMKNR